MEGISFPAFSEPFAEKFADQIEKSMKTGNFRLARDTAEEAWRLFPKDIFFLYILVISQRRCRNSGKAVKNAQLLVEKDPENKWFWRELAASYLARGYVKKAFPAFEKAYFLGIRDLDFLLMFSDDCESIGNIEKDTEILLGIVREKENWREEELDFSHEVYYRLISMGIHYGNTCYDEVFDSFCGFLKKHTKYVHQNFQDFSDLIYTITDYEYFTPEQAVVMRKCLQQLEALTRDPRKKEEISLFVKTIEMQFVMSNKKLPKSCGYLAEVLQLRMNAEREEGKEKASWVRFVMCDALLCAIEERKEILEQEAYISREYPVFYEEAKSYFRQLSEESLIDKYRTDLLRQMKRFGIDDYPGNYFNWYPEKKAQIEGIVISNGEETYVRQNKKIGRNDPCPCGSGKKYKQCCMNKK